MADKKEVKKGHFLRTFFKIIISIFLVIFLFLSVILLASYQFTFYSNIQNNLVPELKSEFSAALSNISEEDWNNSLNDMMEDCKNQSNISLPLGDFSEITDTSGIAMDCSYINENLTLQELIDRASGDIIHNLYYKEYDCDFASCFSGVEPSIFASRKMNEIILTGFLISFGMVLVFIVLLLLLSKPKYTIFYNLAPSFMIAGLPFLVKFVNLPFNLTTDPIRNLLFVLINSFINNLFIDFLIVFIIGIISLVLAIIFKVKRKK